MAKELTFAEDGFALVMTVKYKTGKEWYRSFGPFPTRAKARSFQNKQIRDMKDPYGHYGWTDEKIAERYSWKVTPLWTPIYKEK